MGSKSKSGVVIQHETESVAKARRVSEYGRALKESKTAVDFADVAGRYGLKDMYFKGGKQISKKVKTAK